MTQKDNFEERLLTELRQVVAERPEPARDPAPARSHGTRRPARFAMAGGGLAAAVAAVAIFAGSGDNTPSAYAVAKNPDGAVTVSIKSLKDADGLEASLRDAGVPAEVNYTPVMPTIECSGDSKGSSAARFERYESAKPSETVTFDSPSSKPAEVVPAKAIDGGKKDPSDWASTVSTGPEGTEFTIDPKVIEKGDKVFITTATAAVATTPAMEAGDEAKRLDTAKVALSVGTKMELPDC
ncbi:MAG TPA: hypothetical protein VMF31_08615 [Solirubrobacterales bacterium]|nr:hypothetical protein [Solirubrobacterales bacterium]